MKDKVINFREYLNELIGIDRLLKYSGVDDHLRLHCIGDASGRFLFLQILAIKPSNILEIGTSYGYSTVWLAAAAKEVGAQVTSVERDLNKVEVARKIIDRFNLTNVVTLISGEAVEVINSLTFKPDFILLDGEKKEYTEYLTNLLARVRTNFVAFADNVISHRLELSEFSEFLEREPRIMHELIPIGKGIEMCIVRGE